MKKSNCIVLLMVFSAILFHSCNSTKRFDKAGGTEVWLSFENYSESQLPEMDEMIRNRLSHLTKGTIEIHRKQDGIIVRIPAVYEESTDRINALLTAKGELGFWETYEGSEIIPPFEEANRILAAKMKKESQSPEASDSSSGMDFERNFPIYKYLSPAIRQEEGNSYFEPGPVIGYCAISDTFLINSYLSDPEISLVFPRDLKFAWTIKPLDEENKFVQLIALKISTRDGIAPLNNSYIVESEANISKYSDQVVSIVMNSEGAKIWARLTESNIDRSIAIVIDQSVYSFPRVMAKIENGRSEINGSFSLEEAEDLSALIRASLPVTLKIEKINIVEKE